MKIKAKKEPVTILSLGMEVFHEDIYKGRELMKVVGIREHEVELYGDVTQKSWLPVKGVFRLRKICSEHLKYGMCQLPNVHCGFPGCEPYLNYWGNYVDGQLVDEVEISK